jgi:hypothetical protein
MSTLIVSISFRKSLRRKKTRATQRTKWPSRQGMRKRGGLLSIIRLRVLCLPLTQLKSHALRNLTIKPINGLTMANQNGIEAVPIGNVYFEALRVERIPSCLSSVMTTIVSGAVGLRG